MSLKTLQVEGWAGTLSNALRVGVLVLGPEGDLASADATAARMLGFDDPKALAAAWGDVRTRIDLERLLDGGAGHSAAVEEREPSGGEAAPSARLVFTVHAIDEGRRAGFVLTVRDRMTIDALQADLRLAAQMRGLARLFPAAAHDLRAPLNAMMCNVELLNEWLRQAGQDGGAVGQRCQTTARALKDEITRLSRSLQTLLSQTTLPKESFERFDLRELMQEIVTLVSSQARYQKVLVQTELGDGAFPLLGNPGRLKQAVINIAVNALEAMPGGGRLGIALSSGNENEKETRIAITDTGPGIPQAIMDHLWQMHFTTKSTGTGIGLHVARSVLESHGGRITVSTQPGEGTSFELFLPRGLPAGSNTTR